MKRLTVDQTWRECLAMWKWISRQCLGKSKEWCRSNVTPLKVEWLDFNGINANEVEESCFFCERSKGRCGYVCRRCPARAIDRNFYCMSREHNYEHLPRLFYAELKRLDKIRRGLK